MKQNTEIEDIIYTLKQSDFDLAFQETMMSFVRLGVESNDVLNDLLPRVLGVFEGALQDKYPTEHMIEKFATNPQIN